MTAGTVLDTLRAAGLDIEATTAGTIKAHPASRLTDDLRGLIRDHKAELLDYLRAAANEPEPDLTGWRVTGLEGASPTTVAKFRAASQALDRQLDGTEPDPDRDCWPNDPSP
ncbi:MAG: hypothetical protein QM586_15340, partial [Xenophilus sp.]